MADTERRTVGDVRIGISGWTYGPWRGVFYPAGLPQSGELAHASRTFNSIEVNGTFYSLQRPHSFETWDEQTPDDFVMSVKAPSYITHRLRLSNAGSALANFFASGLLRLGPKLGPILWQLPPFFRFDAARIEAFFKLLPHDTEAAAALARRHDAWMEGRTFTDPHGCRAVRHALEFRHASFVTPEFVTLLRDWNVAMVCADSVAWPRRMDLTSDFVYCRLHGSKELYVSGYDSQSLDVWADRVAAWARGGEPADAERIVEGAGSCLPGRDVFVYFDNDVKVRAPADAQALAQRVGPLLEVAA
jgi:uncharacterized protein YecE (DUF72 family)